MSTITTRAGKGSPLTNTEVDANFTNLNTDKAELSGATFTGEITANGGIALGDNDKATFGAGDDLQIFHDGSASRIHDVGTGDLIIAGQTNIILSALSGEEYLRATENGAVTLYHNNSPKLATTSTGIDVTGTATMDGLNIDTTTPFMSFKESGATKLFIGESSAVGGGAGYYDFYAVTGLGQRFFTNSLERMRVRHDGNVLIGKTADDNTTAGHRFHANGFASHAVTSDSMYLNRLSTDGAVLTLAKDGTTVGSIGTVDGDIYVGTGDTGLFFSDANNEIRPYNTSAQNSVDAAIDLGRSASRFKDLYLSGNALVGRTSSLSGQSGSVSANTVVSAHGGLQSHATSAGILEHYNDETLLRSYGANAGSGKLVFKVGGGGGSADSEAMRIDSSGNVGIGTSSTSSFFSGARQLVVGSGSGEQGITLYGGSNATSYLLFADGTSGVATYAGQVNYSHATNALNFCTNEITTPRMTIDSSGNLLVGTTDNVVQTNSGTGNGGIVLRSNNYVAVASDGSAALELNRLASDGEIANFRKDGTTVGSIASTDGTDLQIGSGNCYLRFDDAEDKILPTNAAGVKRDNTFDLGHTDARFKDLYLSGTAKSQAVELEDIKAKDTNGLNLQTSDGQKRVILDNSGNLLVGKTTTGVSGAGTVIRAGGELFVTRAGDVMNLNRLTSDGEIAVFRKDGTAVGSIGNYGGLALDVGKGTTAVLRFRDSLNAIYPAAGIAGGTSDGVTSLGISSGRFDDIYATNGTIQTSDFNEKQDIAELSDAEQRVAIAAKGLLRKFRWKDSVAEKGDEARTHFGIIAQDLQAAFEAEGLDAGDYAMFISTTWTDEETNEEKTRMGVRYSELLAFIIAAI